VRAIMHLLTSEVWGPVNLVGPQSERSAAVMQALAQRLKRPFWLPAPGFAITALLGQAGKELLLSSQRIQPTVLLADGFSFLDDTVASAIAQTEPHAKK
jgi:NAD dependent epimerase/dehydratase family enzyme